ncbi:MAG TPA: TolC family protein [Terracidiphilus sp.]|jgi:outer membrane protein TolC
MAAVLLAFFATPILGQLSLQTAVDLALENSPRVKAARADQQHAMAALAETKDVFIPGVVLDGGIGASHGIALSVPTIFTVNAQSLVFSTSQRDLIRAARMDLQSSSLTLKDVREEAEEDTVVTYLRLERAELAEAALAQEQALGARLLSIMQQRVQAGIESDLTLQQTRRTTIQISLQKLQMDSESSAMREHLAELIGIPDGQLATVANSIPEIPATPTTELPASFTSADGPAALAAQADAGARLEREQASRRTLWWPQISFAAQYGRVSPINNVSDYYNLHGQYNTAAVGIQIRVPLLDAASRARAREAKADSLHALANLDRVRMQQREDRFKLEHSLAELAMRADLAETDEAIAQDQLTNTETAANGNGGAAPTPKDEADARMTERQRYLDLLDAKLQLQMSRVFLLRQMGDLNGWLKSTIHAGF